MFEKLMKKIEYAKTETFPQRALYEVHGRIEMAFELRAITLEEYLKLDNECVRKGINNPKYFDR